MTADSRNTLGWLLSVMADARTQPEPRCDYCNLPHRRHRRADARYCGNACRQAAYRTRKDHA